MGKCKKCPNIVVYHDAWFEGSREKDFQPLFLNNRFDEELWERNKNGQLLIHQADMETFLCIKMELCDMNLDTWMGANPPQTSMTTHKIRQNV